MKRKILRAFLIVSLVLLSGVGLSRQALAKEAYVDPYKFTLKVGQTREVHIRNARKKIKWSVDFSDGAIKIIKRKKASIVIKGVEVGEVDMEARMGNEYFPFFIKVKAAFDYKNARDVVALKKLMSRHKKSKISRNLDSKQYKWNAKGRLVRIEWAGKKLSGKMDLSGLTALEDFYCDNNDISSLNVRRNRSLEALSCSLNKLKKLDVSHNKKLVLLSFWSNGLTRINLSSNTNLTSLDCFQNKLARLDVSKNNKLEELDCYGNRLESLDVSKNRKLSVLGCQKNALRKLKVAGCRKLKKLTCYQNKLTKLNLSGCASLTSVDCCNNYLESLRLSGCAKLLTLQCSNNKLAAIDLSPCRKLRQLHCYHNPLEKIDALKNRQLSKLVCDRNVRVICKKGVYVAYFGIDNAE